MSYVRIDDPQERGHGPLEVLAVLLVITSLLVLGFPAFTMMTVRIDGHDRRVRIGITVAEAAAAGLLHGHEGDVLSARTGRMVSHRTGMPPVVRVNGRVVKLGRVLEAGDIVRSEDGASTVEETMTVRETIGIPTEVSGKGALLRLRKAGSVGLQEVVIGRISRDVVSRKVLEEPVPMELERYSPPPKRQRKLVALTFDDGPWPTSTRLILDKLRDYKVPATFFVVGRNARREAWLLRRMRDEGHLIANHSTNHPDLGASTYAVVRSELGTTQRIVRKETGVTPTWFRPPGGHVSQTVYEASGHEHLKLVMWTVDPQDWRKPDYRNIAWWTVRATKPGSVILLHDGGGDRSRTVQALPHIIRALRAQGYEFVTLDGLQ